ncbi:PTS transporter subunit EIIB [Chitinilyticum piscinae]|uniref:PTS transporter subunit EIIB n=1 Tax=Chitinilyticum piscinae TaxID=2866724 RepID=A0A8J7FYU5_9NEIS|nr:PTS transporter subunit EIIB [Chitinilyticum piscinae]MBE9608198.1 PTS transporter subunit EIIB [Chitinilyticum piscinae]
MFSSLFKKLGGGDDTAAASSAPVAAPAAVRSELPLVKALGGKSNIRSATHIAYTRVRIELINPALLDVIALRQTGVSGFCTIAPGVYHLIIGVDAGLLAKELE